ncbi:TIGR02679 family protein [Peristeroidobacter soli]|uniref:TIGR02679 family protein n=1 Tax=Peristeroidobacter soli TaxID=2497877 RepID=UPI00101CCA6F|nr:TIGR02679 family protein [Peristeroidobacter soli]
MNGGDSRPPDARLVRLLGAVELAPLRQRLRRHFERHAGRIGSALQLTNLTPGEQDALALLTGRPSRPVRSMRIDIEQLDDSLRAAGIAHSLRSALEILDGPIEHRAALRQARLLEWTRVIGAERWHPTLRLWLQSPVAVALLKRLARSDCVDAEQLLERATRVMRRLPASGITRAQLAADSLGNAHALDNGYPAATLILAALRHEGCPVDLTDVPEENGERQRTPERARDIWARAGVLVNELARPALCLNLPLSAEASMRDSFGDPRYLSLRDLLRRPLTGSFEGTPVHVCENPNIVAIAADELGSRCAPLVCTEGMPAAAQRTLLTQLTHAGARLLYHGDFDWPGLQIANFVMRTWSARPWRFGAVDYQVAVARAPQSVRDLSDAPVVASWDDSLTNVMQDRGLAVAEEAVVAALLEDLASPD